MKPVVWLGGLFLLLTLVFPHGISVSIPSPARPEPVAPDNGPAAPKDSTIATLLAAAPLADKNHVAGTYVGLYDVVARDAGKLVKTTEQWATLQANALTLAVDGTKLKGKYPGLDVAIEAVFENKLGKDKEVLTADDATRAKILEACAVIVSSVR